MSAIIRTQSWETKVQGFALTMSVILREQPNKTWKIKEVVDAINSRNGKRITENEARLALWHLIDTGAAELTPDRQITAAKETP